MGFGIPFVVGHYQSNTFFSEASKVFQSSFSYPLNDSTSEIIEMVQYAENLSSFALPTRLQSAAIRLYFRR